MNQVNQNQPENDNQNENQSKPKIEVVPAMLPEDFEHLKEEINFVKNAVAVSAGYVQIDVVDGMFATSRTWPFNNQDLDKWETLKSQDEGLPGWDKVDFEIDLMVMDQLGVAHDWINVGVSRIIGHLESFDRSFTDEMTLEDYTEMSGRSDYNFDLDQDELYKLLQLKDEFGVEVVMSLNPTTDNKILDPFLDQLDGVQFMGNDRIGYHGVELDEKVLTKIADLRAKKPELPIGIDIGVKFKTLPLLAKAGVTRFSSGSAILKSDDPKKTILDMLKVINESLDESPGETLEK